MNKPINRKNEDIDKFIRTINGKEILYRFYTYRNYQKYYEKSNKIQELNRTIGTFYRNPAWMLYGNQSKLECYYWNNTNIIFNGSDWINFEVDPLLKWLKNPKNFNNEKIENLNFLKEVKVNKKTYFIDKDKNFYKPTVLEIRYFDNQNVMLGDVFYLQNNRRRKTYLRSVVLIKHPGKYLTNKYKNKLWKKLWNN